ncbi:uncharacterized protein LOC111665091 [Seriola lalandi dorsalis]|uniref:uncharacterized protein LOC111665091 n=1 Tax=Seriola lalandi dorsalis TaxID=1841481 RepID=UPI000C6FC3AF|nr:uncharacterized protein LOC111665091 [Seriola lalandi dorsalis]
MSSLHKGHKLLVEALVQEQLSINNLVSSVADADETSQVSRSNFFHIQCILQGRAPAAGPYGEDVTDTATGRSHVIDEDEFFAPQFDYDFTSLTDTETYLRGGEKYERPCGWYRFGLKVLDKYDEVTWLGTSYRSTQSCPGEWPVSYHGTSKKGAEGIIEGHYKPGPREKYGRGIYSTPDISEAKQYAKTFTSKKDKKKYKVILQNRINPKYRKKYNNDKYWLIPIPRGTSDKEEQKMVERAIRPYGLLIKKV